MSKEEQPNSAISQLRTIHQLIEQQAARTPENIAVIYDDQQLSYYELNTQANQLAHYLRQQATEADVRVAICLERSIELMISILAVLKAGWCYVPLDPAYPRERLLFMLQDAEPVLLLTQSHLSEFFVSYQGKKIRLDVEWDNIIIQDKANLHLNVDVHQLAYIIYTSGSTGRPKGVMIEHAGISNLASQQAKLFGIHSGSRVLQFASMSFDAAVSEWSTALSQGATLCMIPGHVQSLKDSLPTIFQQHQISVATLPPSFLAILSPDELPSLKTLIIAGEVANQSLIKQWSEKVTLINAYGPTEATVCATTFFCHPAYPAATIGRALTNIEIYILDEQLQLVTAGITGELYIGGIGLARGYWKQAKLTVEKFISHPFSTDPQARLYKTGDLVRYLADGNIEYLGRTDQQIKLRAHRIEIGEIENVLSWHPLVKQALIIVQEISSTQKQLVAFVTCHIDKQTDNSENDLVQQLQQYATAQLPEYMIPTKFIILNEFPLTSNGKVNRSALIDITKPSQLNSDKNNVPRNFIEKKLLTILSTLLQRKDIGLYDHFFEIGCDSIIVMQLVSQARQAGIDCSIKQVFQNKNIAALAANSSLLKSYNHQAKDLSPTAQQLVSSSFDTNKAYPLSPLQAGMLFHYLYAPHTDVYLIQIMLELKGKVDSRLFQSAWHTVVQRHSILRTVFMWEKLEQPLQYVQPNVTLPWVEQDWRELSSSTQAQQLTLFLQQQRQLSFNLAQAPLLRFHLIRLSTERYYFIWEQHHILLDGWCTQLILQEVMQIYQHLREKKILSLPEARPYHDYIAWLYQQDNTISHAFWQEYLKDCQASYISSVAADIKKLPESFAEHSITLSAALSQQLRELAKNYGLTLNTLFQGIWSILLSHYTRQMEVVFGITVSGRNAELAGIETMLGLFINTLPLRVCLSQELSIIDLMLALQLQMADIQEHAHVSLAKIQSANNSNVKLALFDTLLVFENYLAGNYDYIAEDISLKLIKTIERTEYALTMLIFPADTISIQFIYKTHCFDSVIIAQMPGHIEELIQQILHNPQKKIAALNLLTAAEQQKILVSWNATNKVYSQTGVIHQLIEQQVNTTPAAIALIYNAQQITYRELNNRANKLAHYLREQGIKPDAAVGICAERSLEMVIGILAILKAGACYVPLDPHYPIERLAFILQDATIQILLIQKKLASLFNAYQGLFFYLEEEAKFESYPNSNPVLVNHANDLISIIYTSGSTGKPKGVCNTHKGLVNRLLWMQEQYQLQVTDKVLQKTPFNFDVSEWEFFWPLLAGAQLVIAPPELHRNAEQLSSLIQQQHITVIHFVPSMLQAFLSTNDASACRSLRYVFVSGEMLHGKLQQHFYKVLNAQLHNLYGPTEASIDVSYKHCLPGKLPVTIGRPISNIKLYILNQYKQPMPVGIIGEIYIGGIGLARGYLNNSDLTAEYFIADPFSDDKTARLYKTGDLARYLENGEIEYIGRADQQIKLRGYRIELGEIETLLLRCEGIQQAIVTLQSRGEQSYLLSYLLSVDGIINGHIARQRLKNISQQLAKQLPEYMVPQQFIWLSELPLTPNGKLDRKALPLIASSIARTEELSYQPPQTFIEQQLANIWSELLAVEKISLRDNFFQLGGDSIVSIQVVSRAARHGIQLSVQDLFAMPVLGDLAKHVQVSGNFVTKLQDAELESNLATELTLTPIQKWFFEQNLAVPQHWNQAVWMQLKVMISFSNLKLIVSYILDTQEALHVSFDNSAKTGQQYYQSDKNFFAYEECTIGATPDTSIEQQKQQISTRIQSQLSIVSGPLMYVVLVNFTDTQTQQLLIVAHHLIIDGVSWRILLEQLNQQFSYWQQHGHLASDKRIHSQYRSWLKSLQAYADSAALLKELPYWQQVVKHSKTLLPVDFDRGLADFSQSETISRTLSLDNTMRLLQQVPLAFSTKINDILLTALVLVVQRWCGHKSLYLHMEGHGREAIGEVDISGTLAWFTSLFPVYLDITGAKTIGEAVKLVKEQLRTIPANGIGYGILRYLSDIDITQLTSQAQLCFNYLGQWHEQPNESQFSLVTMEMTGTAAAGNKRAHLIDLNVEVKNFQLTAHWTYSQQHYQPQTIIHLAENYLTILTEIIHLCCQGKRLAYTPSDFPLVSISQVALDKIFQHYPEIAELYPLTPMQSGLLFHALQQKENSNVDHYFRQTVCKFHLALDITAFKQAWQLIIDTYPVLRSGFISHDIDAPMQYVLASCKLADYWQDLDWQDSDLLQQKLQLEQLLFTDAETGFIISQAPLLRFRLIRTATHYYFIWSHHHLLFDGWSAGILWNKLWVCYEHYQRGRLPLKEFTTGYSHYLNWLQQQNRMAAQRFWQYYLAPLQQASLLSTAVTKPLSNSSVPTYQEYDLRISADLYLAIQEFIHAAGITLSTFLQFSWAILLSHYTRHAEVCFGLTASGRSIPLPEIENVVGLLINTAAITVTLNKETDLLTALEALQTQLLEVYRFSFVSLADIQSWYATQQSEKSDRQLFDTLLVFENYPTQSKNMPPSYSVLEEIRWVEKTQYPLTLVILPEESIQIKFIYSTQDYSITVVQALAEQMTMLLQNMLQDANQKLANLDLLSSSQATALLNRWSSCELYATQTIQELFEQQVAEHSDAVAIIDGEQVLSYQQLNSLSNQLAHYLRSLKVGKGSFIGIGLTRSSKVIISILAALKAGAAYVPMDPDYPAERLQFMLADTKADVILTESACLAQFNSERTRAHLLNLDTLSNLLQTFATTNPINLNDPQDIAYVIYTSGSTGIPKGVMNTHANVSRLFSSTYNLFRFNQHDVVALFHSYAFDFSIWEIFIALFYGGQLIIVPYLVACSPSQLCQLLQKHGVTVLNQTPSAFQALLNYEPFISIDNQLSLRYIIFGGEALLPGMLKRWFTANIPNPPQLVNMYGITEITVHATYYPINADYLQQSRSLIGQPLADLQIYILNENLYVCPEGMIGEICIGGKGLAYGYLNRPELTAERFVAQPWNPQERLYKTGDLGRYLPGGVLEYIGRKDSQVKWRGYRIELGEIENILCQCKDVKQAVAILKEDQYDCKSLCAYVVLEKSSKQDRLSHLYKELQTYLPHYMLPASLMAITEFPLTASGKIDRHALASLTENIALQKQIVMPRTPIEWAVYEIWQAVFNKKIISVEEDFFQLGGHSLLATQIITQIRNKLLIELPLRQLFLNSTIASLAHYLVTLTSAKDKTVDIPVANKSLTAPLSFAQQRIFFLQALAPKSGLYHIAVSLRIQGKLQIALLQQAFKEVISRHNILRSSIQDEKQVIQPEVNFLITQQPCNSAMDAAELERALYDYASQAFDLSCDLLIRAKLFQLNKHSSILVIVLHHIIADAWSLNILFAELAQLYTAYCQNKTITLKPVTLQYTDFTNWQHQYLQADHLDQQINYWKKLLIHADETLSLPIDRERPAQLSYQGAIHRCALSEKLAAELKKLAQQEQVTLFMLLLSAYQVLLYRYSGQERIRIGTPFANRHYPGVETIIGLLVNTVVLQADCQGEVSFIELLAQTKQRVLEAYENQDLPFEKLVEELNLSRHINRHPIFQVMFAMQTDMIQGYEWPELQVENYELRLPYAKFDLTLWVKEQAETLYFEFEYATDLFFASSIARLAQHFINLLQGIVEQPRQLIGTLPLLSASEQQKMLVEWNQTEQDYPQDVTLGELFAQQAAQTPQQFAIEFFAEKITYQALNEQANQLAWYLRNLCTIKANTVIAVNLDRSINLIVSLLAITKAGAAYLPLDSDYPTDRLEFMLADSQAEILITQLAYQHKADKYSGIVVCLDDGQTSKQIKLQAVTNPNLLARSSDLVYLIYTSGSTGVPKAISIAHYSLINFITAVKSLLPISASDRVLAMTNVVFDIAGLEIMATLLSGASIILADKVTSKDPQRLIALLNHAAITLMQATPSSWQMLLDQGWSGCTNMRAICGGERLTGKLVSELQKRTAILWNFYGPTETTIWSTAACLAAEQMPVTIGKPLANTKIYILNEQLQPCPIGVSGEICIGGAGVAHAYWNRPELTSQFFINNPWLTIKEKLYKTGDLGRYLADGSIEYIGRKDSQIKWHGYRIELGEIESALCQCQGINQAVVLMLNQLESNACLVAYVVWENEPAANWQVSLIQVLQKKLPIYMVPSQIKALSELPVTINGKINRQALAKLPWLGEADYKNKAAPQTPTELAIADIWANLFGKEISSIEDNFFALGGHSLLAIKMISQVREKLKINLSLHTVFDNPSIAELSRKIEEAEYE